MTVLFAVPYSPVGPPRRRRLRRLAILTVVTLAVAIAGGCSSRGLAGPERVTRSGSTLLLQGQPWRVSGVNEYWLGLDDNVSDADGATYPSHAAVDQGMRAAVALGSKLVRATTLGVSVGCARCLEPTLGHFNAKAFTAIDYAVAAARNHGLRLMIPLTDQGHYFHGGKHTFTNWTGHPDLPGETVSDPDQRAREAAFYTDARTIAAFHDYVRHLLTHRNPLTGLTLAEDPTIAIWETGNELYDAPPAWTQQTAAFLKTLAPDALVADGTDSTGVDIRDTGVSEPDVDIEDAHFYPVDTATATSQAAYTAARHKAYLIGEFPLDGDATTTDDFLRATAADRHVSATLAWTLLPYLANHTPEPHGESYTFHYPPSTDQERTADTDLQQQARRMSRSA